MLFTTTATVEWDIYGYLPSINYASPLGSKARKEQAGQDLAKRDPQSLETHPNNQKIKENPLKHLRKFLEPPISQRSPKQEETQKNLSAPATLRSSVKNAASSRYWGGASRWHGRRKPVALGSRVAGRPKDVYEMLEESRLRGKTEGFRLFGFDFGRQLTLADSGGLLCPLLSLRISGVGDISELELGRWFWSLGFDDLLCGRWPNHGVWWLIEVEAALEWLGPLVLLCFACLSGGG